MARAPKTSNQQYFERFEQLGVCEETLRQFKKDNANQYHKDYLLYPFELLTHPDNLEKTRRYFFAHMQLDYTYKPIAWMAPYATMKFHRKISHNHRTPFSHIWFQRCLEFFIYIKEYHSDYLYRLIYKNLAYEMSQQTSYPYWPHMLGYVVLSMRLYHHSDTFPLPDSMFEQKVHDYDYDFLKHCLSDAHLSMLTELKTLQDITQEHAYFIHLIKQCDMNDITYEQAELYF